jgi:hypothetical protein
MNIVLKRVLTALAIKKAIDAWQTSRRPAPQPERGRVGGILVSLALAGAGAYALKKGKLQPILDKLRPADPDPIVVPARDAGAEVRLTDSSPLEPPTPPAG